MIHNRARWRDERSERGELLRHGVDHVVELQDERGELTDHLVAGGCVVPWTR